MAIGGPASFGAGLFRGLASHRRDAQAQAREQLNEALRLQKEDRESKEAIAKEGLAYDKAKAEAAQAESELALVQQRRAQIMASPGAPFKDAALEGHLEEARSRLEDAHAQLQERQGKLQDLIADRDARVRGAIPPTKSGGFLGFGQSEVSPEKRTPEQREAYKAAIVKGEREQGAEFNKSANPVEREIRQAEAGESRERAKIAGGEKAIETGQSQQGAINEEKRNAQTFPLDKEASELRAKQVEAQSGMAAAAQEIQARQQQQAALQATPGYERAMQGGSATGKGGGGGGLLGAITGKGGGAGGPPAAGAVPTVGQAIGPMLGKVAQMPLPQAAGLIKGVLGGGQGAPQAPPAQQGNYGGQPYTYATPGGPQSAQGFQGGGPLPPQRPGAPLPPQRPQFGQPQSFSGPRQPVQVPVPSVALEGKGGPPAVQQFARSGGSRSWRNNNPGNIEYGPYAKSMGATGSDGRFAIFPSVEAGSRAQEHLLFESPAYKGRTIEQAIAKWAPASENNVPAYVNAMRGGGVSPQTRMEDIPLSQRPALLEAMKQHEGWRPGSGGTQMAGGPKTQSSSRIAPASSGPPLPPPRPASTDQAATGAAPQKQGFKPPKVSAPPVPDVYHPTPSQPIDIKPFAGQPGSQQSPQQMGMQTYGSQQGGQPQSSADIGPPLIHSPEQLKGMKPGSLFRTPDGRLKIVPLVEATQ